MTLKQLQSEIKKIQSTLDNPDRTKSIEHYQELSDRLNFYTLLVQYDPYYQSHNGAYFFTQRKIHNKIKFKLVNSDYKKIYYDYVEGQR